MTVVPLIVLGMWIVLVALIVVEEREQRLALRYKAPAASSDTPGDEKPLASMASPRSRDSIAATTVAGAMAGLSPPMTGATP